MGLLLAPTAAIRLCYDSIESEAAPVHCPHSYRRLTSSSPRTICSRRRRRHCRRYGQEVSGAVSTPTDYLDNGTSHAALKMETPDSSNPRRRVLMQCVALMAQEAGYEAVDKAALETLTEMFQSVFLELGRSTRMWTEAAGRVEPVVGDIAMSLVDSGLGIDVVGLKAFSERSTRPQIPEPGSLPFPKVPTMLSTGKKRPLPSYVPDYFPPMPDSHAFIRTPTHMQPLTDYAACREKTSQQKRDLERSLTRFTARTSPCHHIFPESLSSFPLILPRPVTYLDALVPRDQIFEEDSIGCPLNFVKRERAVESLQKLNDEGDAANNNDEAGQNKKVSVSWELIDNPFLRSPKPFKRKS